MKSEKAKVLHVFRGKPLLKHVIDLAYKINPEKVFVVVGFQRDQVKKIFASEKVEFIDQQEQLGTGHAVLQVKPLLERFNNEILVLSGDVPLLRETTLNEMIKIHREKNAAITLLTVEKDNPGGYGRIVRDDKGDIKRIVEDKDCTVRPVATTRWSYRSGEQKNSVKKNAVLQDCSTECEISIKEVNAGIYCFDKKFLLESLEEIDQNNVQREYYLTDIVKIAFDKLLTVLAVKTRNEDETLGINTKEDLVEAEKSVGRQA